MGKPLKLSENLFSTCEVGFSTWHGCSEGEITVTRGPSQRQEHRRGAANDLTVTGLGLAVGFPSI